jgi:anti-sigma regulatory factor (Ser/Thr protein kinase)
MSSIELLWSREPCLDSHPPCAAPDGQGTRPRLLLMRAERNQDEPLELTAPAKPSALAPIRRAVEAWLAGQRIDRHQGWQIVAACHEACANASEHAYPPSEAGSIELEARKEGPRILVAVRDRGRWRPPHGDDRGRGFTLMNYFMDRVNVERSERGTTVRMERSLGGDNGG